MAKAEYDRKLFLAKCIPFFNTIPRHRFETLYKGFIAVFHEKGEYIYKQESKAEEILVIYQGSCSIEKNLPFISKEEKYVTVMYLQVGDLAGLESLNYLPGFDNPSSTDGAEFNQDFEKNIDNSSQNQKDKNISNSPPPKNLKEMKFPAYKSSLRSMENETIVIHIKISALNEYREAICDSLKNIKNEKDMIIDNLIRQKIDNMNKHKVIYREKQIRRHMKNTEGNEYDQKMNLDKLNNYIEGRPSPIKLNQGGLNNMKNCTFTINKEFINTLRSIKDESHSERSRRSTRRFILENDIEKRIFDDSFYQHLNEYKLEDRYFNHENCDETQNICVENQSDNELQSNLVLPNINLDNTKSSILGRNKRNAQPPKIKFLKKETNNELKTQSTDLRRNNSCLGVCSTEPSSTYQNHLVEDTSLLETYFAKSKIRDPCNSKTYFSIISDGDSQTDRNNSLSIREKILQSMSSLPNDDMTDENFKSNDKLTSTFKALALTPLKNKKIILEQDRETKLLSKKVVNNLKNWDKSLNTKKYMSGRFDMPLISLSQKNLK
jgi:hypothetical protein